jgi:hypothetical protein
VIAKNILGLDEGNGTEVQQLYGPEVVCFTHILKSRSKWNLKCRVFPEG